MPLTFGTVALTVAGIASVSRVRTRRVERRMVFVWRFRIIVQQITPKNNSVSCHHQFSVLYAVLPINASGCPSIQRNGRAVSASTSAQRRWLPVGPKKVSKVSPGGKLALDSDTCKIDGAFMLTRGLMISISKEKVWLPEASTETSTAEVWRLVHSARKDVEILPVSGEPAMLSARQAWRTPG